MMWAGSSMPVMGARSGCRLPQWPCWPSPQLQAPPHAQLEHLSWEQQQQMQWQRQQLEIACGDAAYPSDNSSARVDARFRAEDRSQAYDASQRDQGSGPREMWPWDKSRFEEEELRQKQREEARQQAEERRKIKEECSRVNKAIREFAERGDFRAAAQQVEAAWRSNVEIEAQTLVAWLERCGRAGVVPLAEALRIVGVANEKRNNLVSGAGKGGATRSGEIRMDINSYTKMIQGIVSDLATVISAKYPHCLSALAVSMPLHVRVHTRGPSAMQSVPAKGLLTRVTSRPR